MKRHVLAVALSVCSLLLPRVGHADDLARWKAQAERVTIIRDTWGVPHVYGKTDADAIFGMLYAQAEDDFNRIEMNFINASGRLAEVEGEAEVWRDLRMKLFIDPADMKKQYAASPLWLKQLMNAWADGLNYYLATHPNVKPKLLTRFEPWMALTFSEGSIGGDISTVQLRGIEEFYGKKVLPPAPRDDNGLEPEPQGSNGIAIGPKNTVGGRSLLLLNPHTSFYFRPEVNVVSEEGLNVYGAVTWGQFFVYQGFNDRLGWMHTTGGGDIIDEYKETVIERGGKYFYKYGNGERPFVAKQIALPYKSGNTMATRVVTAYFSHHGPIIRATDGQWIAVKMMNEPLKALTQSYMRTKARNYAEFYKAMELRTNSSNNTIYADGDGNIAYFHGNFLPKRDTTIDFSKPVDGSDPRTEWQGLHTVKETITLFNPNSGWLFNTNNWPWEAAGTSSPRRQDYPKYMSAQGENARGPHAVRVLQNKKDFTLDGLIAAANDTYLTGFDATLPALLRAYDGVPDSDTLKTQLAEQIAVLRAWDQRYSLTSVPTSLAIYWAMDIFGRSGGLARAKGLSTDEYVSTQATPAERLSSLARASQKLTADFGSWKTPWGEINRFQRLSADISLKYDDSKPSIAVPFPSATWGSLASFGAVSRNTKRMYGESGNSFIAVVEFGPRIKAKSLLAGGVSGDPSSKHFTDQAEIYSKSQFKDVWFYRADVEQHVERSYHPGK
jgi:acyl-homoserine-lactone acylase